MLNFSKMDLNDLNIISPILQSDFDDFWNENILKLELENENSYYIVAKEDNDIVGFGGLWKSIDDIHLTNIVTKKNLRNKGIGKTILNELINQAKNFGYNIITLEVNENNLPALSLYKKFGFKEVGIRKKYYNNSDSAIIMNLNL
ncbi:MAG: ribosomal protein S18-alanine N-acetyltransferase [Clostridia bacterium]|nr:ribosomal protein S18-alanine N-acetyltransferase [Clostridia bacterium]